MRFVWPRALLRSTAGALDNEVLRRLGLVFVANTLARGLAFGFFVLAARWLDPQAYGAVRSALSWAALLCVFTAPFSLVWTRTIAAAEEPGELRRQTSAGLAAFAILLGATLAAGAIWVAADRQLGPSSLAVLAGLGVLYAAEGYLKGRMAFGRLAAYLLAGNLLQLAALAALRWLRPDLLSADVALWLYGLAYLLPLLPLLWPAGLPPAPGPADVGRVLRDSLGLVVVNSANTLIVNLDLLLLGYLGGAAQVGYYGVAKTVLGLFLVLSQTIFTVIMPISARRGGRPGVARQAALVILGGSLLIALGVIALAGPLVGLVFTERYLPAVPALRVLMIGGWCYLALTLFMAHGLGRGRDRAGRAVYGAVCALLAVLLAALTPTYGMIGSAWAFTAACAVGCLLGGLDWYRERGRRAQPAPAD